MHSLGVLLAFVSGVTQHAPCVSLVPPASVPLDVSIEVVSAALICVGRSDTLRCMTTVVDHASVHTGAKVDIRIGAISVSDFALVGADTSVLGKCV